MAVKLIRSSEQVIGPGRVFRFPASYPYEPYVEFMVYQHPGAGCGLIVSTGRKAGLVAVVLPEEAQVAGHIGLSTQWLVRNWEVWVWPHGQVDDVELHDAYPAPSSM